MNKNSINATKLDIILLREEIEKRFEDVDKKQRVYRDQILTGLDEIMKELETMREENAIGVHQARELREDVEAYEKRITKLESPTQ